GGGYTLVAESNGCQSQSDVCNGSSLGTVSASNQRLNQTTGDASSLSVKAYPNPFGDRINFQVTSPVSGRGTLEVYNALGQKIRTVFEGNVARGSQSYTLNLPLRQQANLIYVLRVGDKQVSGKIL